MQEKSCIKKHRACSIILTLIQLLLPCSVIAQNTSAAQSIVNDLSDPHTTDNGLQGKHIALWGGHGYYYDQKDGKWEWQRPRLMGTVEDLNTADFTINYLLPMLENAGATVFMPRERDINSHEYIVDNDTPLSTYEEWGKWQDGSQKGFAHKHTTYSDCVNPFEEGTYRWTKSTSGKATAGITWNIPIEENGRYAVYVSYKMVNKGATDARYIVHHAGGTSEYSVNQTMGGGTWVYIGSFDMERGGDNRVVLNNTSSIAGEYITADAIKVGGGMGNVARKPCHKPRKATRYATKAKLSREKKPRIKESRVSGMPRYAEAARYWLQWAGIPDDIYSDTGGNDDYREDLRVRPYWVDYLCGGSKVLPKEEGLNIPVDMALAIHSNAGRNMEGSLGIVYTGNNKYNKLNYYNSRKRKSVTKLHNQVINSIENDIKNNLVEEWKIHEMKNGKYAETKFLEVPTLLLEFMSHQDFNDMRWGLDPRFRLLMSRAIYKGVLRYLTGNNCIVQPLPVDHMALQWKGTNEVLLSWKAVTDSLEKSATPTGYKVYVRKGEYGWDNGTIVHDTQHSISIEDDVIYSFYVTGINAGGESLPSEILTAHRSSIIRRSVMIVNAFDRISAPEIIDDPSSNKKGFRYDLDFGVPYRYTLAYTGEQYNLDYISIADDDPDEPKFGASHSDYEGTVVAGNTFDYPYQHGECLARLGYSFLSISDEALSSTTIHPNDFPYVDVIMGKERQVFFGNDSSRNDYEPLTEELTSTLTAYCRAGGNMLISGAYIGYDSYDGRSVSTHAQDFITDILHCEWSSARNAHGNAMVRSIADEYDTTLMKWNSRPNPHCYSVEQSDIFLPIDDNAVTFLQYNDGSSAAVACDVGLYRCCTLGFPIEAITNKDHRLKLMRLIFDFLQ